MKQHEHFLEQHDPDRKDFQIDRIILFSDAVFAIAITLLIIEIKAPEVHSADAMEQLQQLAYLIPKFVGFIISFFVIAIYWRSHHRIFGFVNNYSERLIWLNILFLFTIVLMPFSSAYLSDNFLAVVPFTFYNVNVILTGIANYALMRYIFNKKNKMIKHQPDALFIHLFRSRALAIPAFFLVCTLLPLTGLPPNPAIYVLIWPMLIILRWYNARRYRSRTRTAKAPTE